MGECPDWYMTLRASRYLGVAPWDLVERPRMWQTLALEAEAAELHAKNEAARRNRKNN